MLRSLEDTGRMAAPSEQKVLAKYVGWGGLAQAFDADKADWSREHAELKALLTPEEWAAAARSTRYAHYTSREIIVDGIYAALRRFGFRGGRTLEGGAGVGNFIGLMPLDMRSASRFTAIEREPFSAAIARHLYPLQNVQQADFTGFVGNDDFYDTAVGNPPFASDPQTDTSGRKHLNGLSLHNYFFAKEVDMLRDGGILAQVITNGFLDAKADTARKYISDRTRLLGAIRLPNNAFSKNAGTEVTTDLIFLQKRPEAEWGGKAARLDAKRWLDISTITDAEGRQVPLNQYFIDNPQMMLGKFGAYGTMYRGESPALVQRPGQDTDAMLRQAVEALPADVYTDRAVSLTAAIEQEVVRALKDPTVQEGGYFLRDGKLQQRIKDIAGEARSRDITASTKWTEKTTLGDAGVARLTGLAELRTTLRALLAAELTSDPAMDALRANLNQQYDAYAKDHGLINDKGTLRVFDDDPDFPLLSSLEHGYTPGIGLAAARTMGIKPFPAKASKAPIFTRRVIDARKQVQTVKTPADALAVSMAERGKLDSSYIGKLLGRDPDEVLAELAEGNKPLLFRDPASDEYVLRDAYLSGNVRAKLIQAKQAGMFGNIRALEEVQPVDVGSHEIVARVGSPWVPSAVYEDFAKALFGTGTKASIRYVKLSAGYTVSITPENGTANTNTWGTGGYTGADILAALLNNRPIRVTYKDADGNMQTDKAATEAANIKAQDVRNKFQDWLFTDADRAEILVRAYNDTNNNYVTREFDGSWMTFPGKVPDAIVKFRRHQRNAIARIVQDRTALLDHVVGAGKTYTVIAAAMELKRTGLSKKPLIVVPNHLVKQWAADFYRLYPGANILTATKKDFDKDNRRKFLAKIATGDWDAVIMAHSSFGFIKPAPEFESRFNAVQIKAIVDTIKQVEDGDGDKQQKKRTVKQLEGLKERLENRIKSLRDKPMDALLDFEEIGIDQLFVDEAHLFKNLMFSTKMQNIAGLGDSKGSQRAYDMFVKTNQVMAKNGRGQGVVFATGTPVSNSLAEMYHMMRYLMPNAMEEMGFQSFDAWANTYASVEQVWMQKASGDGFKPQNRMSNFVNTPELLKLFDQVSDTVTMDDIKSAFREENEGKEFPLPKLKGGKRTPVSMRKSKAQDAYMATIATRAQRLESRKGPPQKGDDNILVLMTDARKAAMDIRLVDPTITDREPGGRIDRSAQEIAARYNQYDKVKGTQLVFSDLGTPLKTVKKELVEFQELQARIEVGSGEDVQIAANLGNEAALAKIEDAEDAQEELDAKGRDWVGAMQAAQRGFSVYDDLKAALIEKGIPDAEIAFIHDFNTDEQKAALFRKVNAGQIRVLMGSTPKLGAGTNVQERLVALHHLDVPWKPSDVEQREGRIIRQGNLLDAQMPGFEVEVLAYVTQDSLDMRMWQVQETKLKMINQLRTRKVGREVDNAFEDLELSAGEMQAAATGNMDLLREIQLRADIKKLEQRKRAFDAQKTDLQNRKKNVEQTLAALPAKIDQSRVMADGAAEYRKTLDARTFSATIEGKAYTDPKEAGQVLQGFVDAKEFGRRMKGEDGKNTIKVITPAEHAAMAPEEAQWWIERAAPLSVEFNGENYTSRAKLADAFAEHRGDVSPILWAFNGTEFARRTPLATALRQDAADALVEQAPREIGSIGPFAVTIEGGKNSWGEYVEVLLEYGGKEVSTTVGGQEDAAKLAGSIINAADNMANGAQQQYSYQQHQLSQALKQKAELEATPMPGEWPDADKLTQAREAHQKILRNLAAAGVKVEAPEPGSTIDTLGGDMQATGKAENDTDVLFSRGQSDPVATTPDNSLPQRAAVAALNGSLVRYGLGDKWRNAYAAVALPDAVSGIREALQAAFGRNIRPVAPTAAEFDLFNGVYLPNRPNDIFVNVAAKPDFIAIAGHELWHSIKRDRPDLIAWYRGVAAEHYKDLDAYQDRLNKLLQPGEKHYGSDQALEELEADFLGDSLSDQTFLQRLADASPAKFKSLLNAVVAWLKTVAGKLNGLKSSAHVKDVDALRGYLEQVLVAFAEGKAVPAAPQSSPLFQRGLPGTQAEDGAPWYSELARQIESSPMNAGPASAWLQYLESLTKRGVKPDEIEWSGVREWAALQIGKLTKAQVLEYLDGNGVQVTETVLAQTSQHILAINRALRGTEYTATINDDRESIGFADPDGDGIDFDDLPDDIQGKVRAIAPMDAKPTKYGNYTVPGGTNYREVLLTLPVKPRGELPPGYQLIDEAEEARADGLAVPAGEVGPWRFRGPSLSSRSYKTREEAMVALLKDAKSEASDGVGLGDFRSSHWDQPNVLAHIRLNDRTDAEGKRVLFVEELQSDWGQHGKRRGFAAPGDAQRPYEVYSQDTHRALSRHETLQEADAEVARRRAAGEPRIDARMSTSKDDAPAAPFVTATDKWLALSLKRIIKLAVDEGYDKVAFVTGEQSAERYDLSKQISRVEYTDKGVLIAIDINGREALRQEVAEDKIEDYIGKEAARKLLEAKAVRDPGRGDINAKTRSIEGGGLKVGGEGMKAFYDSIVPTAIKALLKKMGGGGLASIDIRPFDVNELGRLIQPGFEVTDSMRDKARGGMPLFSRADTVDRMRSALTVRNVTNYANDLLKTEKSFNWWHRTVGTQFHKASTNPLFAAVYNKAQEYLHDTSAFANDPANMAPDLLPQLRTMADIKKSLALPEADRAALERAVNGGTLVYTRNSSGAVVEAGENDTAGVVFKPAELRSMFKFTDRQVLLYEQFRAATDRSLDILVAADVARFVGDGLPADIKAMISTGDTGRFKGLVTAFALGKKADAEATLAEVRRGARNEMSRFWTKQKAALEGKGGAAGTRLATMEVLDAERAALQLRLGGERYRAEQALAKWVDIESGIRGKFERIDQLKAQGYAPLMRFGRYTVDVVGADGARLYFGMYESEREANAAARLFGAEFDGATVQQGILSEEAYKQFSGMTPETIELFAEVAGVEKTDLFQEYLRRAKNNRSAMKRLIHRKGVSGFSTDVSRVLASFLTSNARASSSSLHLGELAATVEQIPKEHGDIKDEAIKLREYVQNPQEEAQAIRSLLFVQYLGGSVASAMVNMTQPIMMTLPYLSQFGGPAKAASRLAAAAKTAVGKIDPATPLGKALALAEKEGIVSPQELHQLQGEASRTLVSHPAARRMLFIWGGFFSLAEQFNRRLSFIAAFKTAQEEGMSDPFKFAASAVDETQGVYNKANRPNWARGAVGATLFTFKQYSISYVEFLTRLPKRERLFAMAILLLMAGAGGLPGADDLDDVVDTIGQGLGYDTNSKLWKLRVLTEAAGEDWAEFMLHGFSAMPGFPLDVSGRLGLGNLIPGTGLLLKSKADKSREIAEALGPAGSSVINAVNALPSLLSGDIGKANQIAGFTMSKNLGKAMEMYLTGEYRDMAGRKVANASLGDAIVKGIGFQPAHVAEDSRKAQMANQQVTLAKTVEAEISSQWAAGMVDKKPEQIQRARQRLTEWNKANPRTPIVISRSQIAARVKQMGLSRDARFVKSAPKEMRAIVAEVVN